MDSKHYQTDESTRAGQQPGADVMVDFTGQTRHPDVTSAADNAADDVGLYIQYTNMLQQKYEAERRLTRVMNGCLDDLPPLQSKIVRIFTSSTFTDTTLERNMLMETVYPRLKDYCRERHGLDFQVVDMRWGVRDEATDDHVTTGLCLQEIDTCQRLSVGPNFCVLLGQKYGYRPLPTIIPANELEMLCDVITREQPSGADVQLLQQWYKKDKNSIEPIYVLQSISSIITNFKNKRQQRQMQQAQSTWWKVMTQLQSMLRYGAFRLFLDGQLSREQLHNYVISVTEREVRRAITDRCPTAPEHHCLAYVRHITDINLTDVRAARNFVDITSENDVDVEAERRLSELRDDLLPSQLSASNVRHFTVPWKSPYGLDVISHDDYLNDFCSIFYSDVTRLVDEGVAAIVKPPNNRIYTEVLRHLHTCQTFISDFEGRTEIVDEIREYVCGESTVSLILSGESGCGKTSILAKAYSQTRSWVQSQPLTVIRFLGTSPDSSSLVPLLRSICKQVSVGHWLSVDVIPSDTLPLINFFTSLLSRVATRQCPLFIFLDSLDMLSPADGAHLLAWFPASLPPHCKLVASVVASHDVIVARLRSLSTMMVHVGELGEALATTILTSWLRKAGRTVTHEQQDIIDAALHK